ncbi:TRAP transporter substrate-binding protein [Fretibacter rubidus]|uniref:TRAP transporter substrate-binding protein n=1 Tax=Fretibacter rubidus TaxID=570162 RepID=UPI00352B1CEC
MVKRRDIITAAAAVATGAGVLGVVGSKGKPNSQSNAKRSYLSAPNLSQNRREFRMATSWPKDFPGLGQMANYFAKALRDLSDGRLDVKVFAAGELVGALECFDATSTGAADMYHSAEYYWQGKSKGFSFFTTVPNGMTATEIMGWIDHGGGQQLWDKLSENFNIKPFQAGNTGHQMGGWYKREMNTLEDFQGLKMRIPGIGGEVIRRLGGSPVQLAGGEIYQSLQSGAIDATEWVGPWNDIALGFYREAPFYYGPGFHEPGASLAIGTNLDVWNALPASDQAMIKYACAYANHWSLGEYSYRNGLALETLKTDYGVTPRVFSDDITKTVFQIAEDVVADMGSEDASTRAIYESYRTARNAMRGWTEISDGAFIKARQIAMDG